MKLKLVKCYIVCVFMELYSHRGSRKQCRRLIELTMIESAKQDEKVFVELVMHRKWKWWNMDVSCVYG